jgi:hypothetical protein
MAKFVQVNPIRFNSRNRDRICAASAARNVPGALEMLFEGLAANVFDNDVVGTCFVQLRNKTTTTRRLVSSPFNLSVFA